jgi:hypothetical protein
LQHVSKRFLDLGRDDTLWREQCFNSSSFLTNLRRRQQLIASEPTQESRFRDLARALANGNGLGDSRLFQPREEARDLKARSNEKIRIMANWDPSYPEEKVQWYDEYIARNAPISISWLQQPRNRESPEHEYLEVRGMGIYTPPGEEDATLVVGPLDDGSVCLWDISGRKGRKGSIIARSKSGLISGDPASQIGTGKHSKLISTGVTECVSVDSSRKRAFFAVQHGMALKLQLEYFRYSSSYPSQQVLRHGSGVHKCSLKAQLENLMLRFFLEYLQSVTDHGSARMLNIHIPCILLAIYSLKAD